MNSLKFQSVFDIIGPVMIGPSSSHTAGAVRIGKIVSSIFGEEPKEVHMNEAFGLFGLFKKKAMLLTQTQRLLLLKMIIKRFLSPESQLVVGTYKLLS